MPTALIIRTAGTNCDSELMHAFALSGARPTLQHLDRVLDDPAQLERYDLIAFPGGFSYGDDVASGRIFAMRVRERLYPALRAAVLRGCPIAGICNGFQVLVQVGLLPGPGPGEAWPSDAPPPQSTALAHNAGGRFIDRWVRVRANPESPCLWTQGLAERMNGGGEDATMMLPIAHGEGRFVAASPGVLRSLEAGGQVALRYTDNVNGSEGAIAGICDVSGRIFGLMPHPERYLDWTRHPFWTRLEPSVRQGDTPGLAIFRNAVRAAEQVAA